MPWLCNGCCAYLQHKNMWWLQLSIVLQSRRKIAPLQPNLAPKKKMRGFGMRNILLILGLFCAHVGEGRHLNRRQVSETTVTTSSSSSTSSDSEGNILTAIQNILSGAVDALTAIIDVKHNSVAPAVEAASKAGEAVVTSPIVKSLGKAGEDIVNDIHKNGPSLVNTAANIARTTGEATHGLFRAAVCTLFCPFQGDADECRKDNRCNGQDEN